MSKGKNRNDILASESLKTKILKSKIPYEYHINHIIEKDNEVLFSLEVVSKYLVFLSESTILIRNRNSELIEVIEVNNIKYLNINSIIRMLNDCSNRNNRFRTIDINNEREIVSVIKDNKYIYDIQTPLYIVDDYNSVIKYTLEARFLYTVFKYLQYLKYETKEKVFLQGVDIIHPQYDGMKPFRFDLYIPSAKICIEYLESYHNRTPEQIKLDEIRLKVIEHQDIKVMTYDTNQEDKDPMKNLINFLLNLKNTIIDRSLYFTNKKLTIDQYLYVFEKNGIENIDIARKMLEIRENKKDYKLLLEDACDTIKIKSDKYDLALEIVKYKLDKDQYKYDGEFKVENIFLNAAGFCDFCVLVGTRTSKQILHYYRQIEDICIKMIDDKQERMIEENRKKKEYEIVVNNFLKKNWTYDLEAETNIWKKKYNKLQNRSKSEINLLKKKNRKTKKVLNKIKELNLMDITSQDKKNGINKELKKVIFDKNKKCKLKNNDIIIPELDCLVYKEETYEEVEFTRIKYKESIEINPIYLSQVTEKYNQYNSTSLTNNQIKEKFNQFSDQINFYTPPECFGKTNEITITNVKWVSDDEYDSNSDFDSEYESNSDYDVDV